MNICFLLRIHIVHFLFTAGKKASAIQYGIRYGELMQARFPKRLCMGTARMKWDKETEVVGKKRGMRMEEKTSGSKNKRRPRAYHYQIKI